MPKFVDRDGEEWYPQMRFSTLKEVQEKLDVNAIPRSEEEAGEAFASKLQSNPHLIPEVLAMACDDTEAARDAFDRGPMQDVMDCFQAVWQDFIGGDVGDADDSPTKADKGS